MPLVEERTTRTVEVDADVLSRVEAGIEVLKEKAGRDWADRINSGTLQLSSCNSCILGQLYGDFSVGMTAIGLSGDDGLASTEVGTAHGFVASASYAELNRVWKLEVARYTGADIELVGV